jgi:hypothetical protein
MIGAERCGPCGGVDAVVVCKFRNADPEGLVVLF